jgi:hypothetical protein
MIRVGPVFRLGLGMPRVDSRSTPKLSKGNSGAQVRPVLRSCGSFDWLARRLNAPRSGPALQGQIACSYSIELFEESFSLSVVQRVELGRGYL